MYIKDDTTARTAWVLECFWQCSTSNHRLASCSTRLRWRLWWLAMAVFYCQKQNKTKHQQQQQKHQQFFFFFFFFLHSASKTTQLPGSRQPWSVSGSVQPPAIASPPVALGSAGYYGGLLWQPSTVKKKSVYILHQRRHNCLHHVRPGVFLAVFNHQPSPCLLQYSAPLATMVACYCSLLLSKTKQKKNNSSFYMYTKDNTTVRTASVLECFWQCTISNHHLASCSTRLF